MRLLRNKRGQGMTEYIIIVALIAVAAIAAFAYFGQTIRSQTAAMSESIAGDSKAAQDAVDDAKTAAGNAKTQAETDKSLQNYVEPPSK